MEYVDKQHHRQAHSLEDGFLQRNKDRHDSRYTGDLYEYLGADFCAPGQKTKKVLVTILEAEQHNRCCYCMRNLVPLKAEDKSIEHVIVNHPTDDAEYNKYLMHGSSLDNADIIQSSLFLDRQTPPPPYPHSIAYENMLMSCAGRIHIGVRTSFTCNGKRCHAFVPPMPLMQNISREMKYRKDGSAFWTKDSNTEVPFVEILGLNDPTLQIVRRIWYKLSLQKLLPNTCDKESLVYDILGDMLDEGKDDAQIQLLFLFVNNNQYWDLVQQYDYFNDVSRFC